MVLGQEEVMKGEVTDGEEGEAMAFGFRGKLDVWAAVRFPKSTKPQRHGSVGSQSGCNKRLTSFVNWCIFQTIFDR